MKSALIVFAKAPVAGRVKTRLTPEITEAEAADLYEAFLRDLLERFVRLDVHVRVYVAGHPADLSDDLVPTNVEIFRQEGSGLGERMGRAFIDAFAAGYDRVILTGSDHPTLPSEFIEYAFAALAPRRAVVLGPADDGGYYLLGMNDFLPQLFEGMEYSHADVLTDTLERLPAAEIDVTILPTWYDVDTPRDLRRLAAELAAEGEVHTRTREVLSRLAEHHSWIDRNDIHR